jgi:hypothetical protein
MQPTVDEGFVIVAYDGDSQARIEMGLSAVVGELPRRWYDAYLDYYAEKRVAKIMVPTKQSANSVMCHVYIRVNGAVTKMGSLYV